MTAKTTNGAAPDLAAIVENTPEIKAFMNQCVKLPRLCPFARTRFGKTSLKYTQITAPWEKANDAIKPTSSQTSSSGCRPLAKIAATPARDTAVPTAPISNSFFSPEPVDRTHRDHPEHA